MIRGIHGKTNHNEEAHANGLIGDYFVSLVSSDDVSFVRDRSTWLILMNSRLSAANSG